MAESQSQSNLIDIAGCRVYVQEPYPIIDHEPVTSSSVIRSGDHIIYCVTEPPYRPAFQSAVVVDYDIEANVVKILCNTAEGIKENTQPLSTLNLLHRMIYSESYAFDADKAIKRAWSRHRQNECHYDPLTNSSHHFVSWCKCGIECSLSDVIQRVEGTIMEGYHDISDESSETSDSSLDHTSSTDEHQDFDESLIDDENAPIITEHDVKKGSSEFSAAFPYNLVLRRKKVESITDIKCGDHVASKSKHWLVESANRHQFTGYSYTMGKIITKTVTISDDMCRIIYPKTCAINVEDSLKRARRHVEKQETISISSSDQYVTMMKCGRKYEINESCLINDDARPIGCTRITSDVKLAEGDHLLIKTESQYASVIVCKITRKCAVSVVPDLNGNFNLQELCITSQDEVHRVNYDEHLPPDVIIKRALSTDGYKLLHTSNSDTGLFATWATTGKCINIQTQTLLSNRQLKHVVPSCYKCITALSEIHPGDHLFIPNKTYRWHFMVTECGVGGIPTLHKVIYFLRGVVRETSETLDVVNGNIFKIFYNEQFPAEKAIFDARFHVSKKKLSAFYRTEFVRMVKTGSTEGLEVDFMIDLSVPSSKDSISCFTQLNPGDYLVIDYGKASFYYHCLVAVVHSPGECEVIGLSKISVKPTRSCVVMSDCKKCYRINYFAGVCRPVEQALALGDSLCEKKWLSGKNYQSFVNFFKTGNSTYNVDVDQLQDKRLCLKRQQITNAMDLKVGDHIERPLDVPLPDMLQTGMPFLSNKMHHMLVTQPINESNCKVIEAHVKSGLRKASPRHHEVNIFQTNEVFRIVYAERINPDEGIKRCLQECKYEQLINETFDGCEIFNPVYEGINPEDSYPSSSNESTNETDDLLSQPNTRRRMKYHVLKNNCEHLVMLGTIGRKTSFQISIQLHHELRKFTEPVRSCPSHIGDAVTRSVSKGALKAVGKVAGGVLVRATARAAARGGLTGTVAETSETVSLGPILSNAFRVGYPAAINGVTVGLVSGVAGAINLGVEGTLLTRGIYKLKRKKKFNLISETEYRRGVTKQAFTRVNTFLGATGGAIAGQLAIPVPLVGAVVGSVVGTAVGKVSGHCEGIIASNLIKEKNTELPIIVHCIFSTY